MSEASGCSGNCSSCSSKGSCSKPQSLLEPANHLSEVKKVIGIVSGKGGVGKSMVTSSLAVMMQRRGFSTAILDADITGPSIPKMFGITGRAQGTELGIDPRLTSKGTEVMSVNLLLENTDDPVVWRGPVIAGTVKQFWSDVVWGEVDYMFIAGHRRCSADCFPVDSGGRHRHRDLSAGSGFDDCQEGLQDGKADECSDRRYRREYELPGMPGLRQED